MARSEEGLRLNQEDGCVTLYNAYCLTVPLTQEVARSEEGLRLNQEDGCVTLYNAYTRKTLK